jgi:aerobic-type carbon monoxide dehydrogenase small subunit (CoxS/CutS family)
VIVDGLPERSCQVALRDVQDKEVITIEGLARGGELHPLQEAFVGHGALQCGFCTPGMILSAYALLLDNPTPTRGEIIDGMEDNLCRCAAHKRIVTAIEDAAGKLGGER